MITFCFYLHFKRHPSLVESEINLKPSCMPFFKPCSVSFMTTSREYPYFDRRENSIFFIPTQTLRSKDFISSVELFKLLSLVLSSCKLRWVEHAMTSDPTPTVPSVSNRRHHSDRTHHGLHTRWGWPPQSASRLQSSLLLFWSAHILQMFSQL